MRSNKSTGGLTRGRGMGEAQRARWLLAMPACADINSALQELTYTTFVTSEQHKDASNARQARDHKDRVALLGFLQDSTMSKNSTTVQLHSLPPTSASASYHSARVYLQVQQWMGKGEDLYPEEWGWLRMRNRLEPRMTDLPPAPEALLKVVRCTCKHDCDTRRWSFKKHGLDCSVACGECKGISCTNSRVIH